MCGSGCWCWCGQEKKSVVTRTKKAKCVEGVTCWGKLQTPVAKKRNFENIIPWACQFEARCAMNRKLVALLWCLSEDRKSCPWQVCRAQRDVLRMTADSTTTGLAIADGQHVDAVHGHWTMNSMMPGQKAAAGREEGRRCRCQALWSRMAMRRVSMMERRGSGVEGAAPVQDRGESNGAALVDVGDGGDAVGDDDGDGDDEMAKKKEQQNDNL